MIDSPASSASVLSDSLREAFPHSRPETRRALAASALVREFGPGETIWHQGDDPPVPIVLAGHIALRRNTFDGRQLIVVILSRGKLANVLPLIRRPVAADAVALTPGAIAQWSVEDLRTVARSDPGLADDLLDHVIAIVDELAARLDGLLYQDAIRRVARILHVYAGLFFVEPPILVRAQLPGLVGTSREMTGRVLRILEADHLVAREGRDRLRLLDRDGLAALARVGAERPSTGRGTSSSS